MVLYNLIKTGFGVVLVLIALFSSASQAQTVIPNSDVNASVMAPFRSAFDGYRAYSDDAITNWKAANDNVAQIGGWREYARQAQQPDDTPSPANKALDATPKATTKATP